MPNDLADYGFNPGEFKISTAIRMSCAIPLIFTPVILNEYKKPSYIVDGGILSNFPVWAFDIEGSEKYITYGLKINDKPSFTSKGKTDLFSYVLDILNTPLNDDRVIYVRDKNKLNIINIDNYEEIKSTDFYKIKDYKEHLYSLGYDCVKKHLKGS